MFKSRIPLQTPIVIKLLLLGALAISFIGWSISSKTSGIGYSLQTSVISVSESDN